MAKTTIDIWNAHFQEQSALFDPIRPAFNALNHSAEQWPGLADFQSLLSSHPTPISNHLDFPIQFVEQAETCQTYQEQYEPRIYLTGEVQTRLKNWHDFLQVLVWKTFPKTKMLLNTQHYRASSKRIAENKNNRQRTATENFLTLFDECGVVIISHDKSLLDLIKNFQWPTLFWDNRSAFNSAIECFTFGHAMYEKALNPYIGMTANAILLHVDETFFDLSYAEKLRKTDALICAKIAEKTELIPKERLTPFPILGVPQWHKENESLAFYLNESYFRRGRRKG